tara:strand:+ start:1634 stop:2038 length:405 start_codon:yes stop_codon:yes gene_type:complete
MMQKTKYFLLFVPACALIFLFTYGKISSGITDIKENKINIDEKRNEGFVAFVVNETEAQPIAPKPHPDAEKCACKGTGYIWHGDGHQTKCPYHEEPEEDEDDNDEEDKHRCRCDTATTYCNCKNAYGKCQCKKR